MKKSNIIKGVAALSLASLLSGGIIAAQAATNNSKATISGHKGNKQIEKRTTLTAAQKAAIKVKMEAVKKAIADSDYNAWAAAMKDIDANSPILKQVTEANFPEYVAKHKQKETKVAEHKTKEDAIIAALNNNDYSAWVTAVKAENANSPLLEKINSTNFPSYVQAYDLRKQADDIMKNLGLENSKGMGDKERGHEGIGFPIW